MLSISINISAQYLIDYKNSATYTTTCGSVNAAQWEVKDDSCQLYTAVLYPTTTNDSVTVIFTIRINQSGNLNNTDKVYIHLQRNSESYNLKKSFNGANCNSVFTYTDSIRVSKSDNFKFRISMHNTSKSNFWQIKNGDISVSSASLDRNLPIELLSFNAKSSKNFVLLKWATAAEINNDHFTIEKSNNGINFNEVATINGTGNSNTLKEYAYSDENPYTVTYYRLKQTDFNGAYTYSPIISVNASTDENPLIDYVANNGILKVILHTEYTGNVTVNIYNAAGSIIYTGTSVISKENQTIEMTTNLPSKNIYLVSINRNEMNPVVSKIFIN